MGGLHEQVRYMPVHVRTFVQAFIDSPSTNYYTVSDRVHEWWMIVQIEVNFYKANILRVLALIIDFNFCDLGFSVLACFRSPIAENKTFSVQIDR